MRGRAALTILALLLLFPLLAPVIEAMVEELPPWLSLLLLAFIGLSMLQGLAALLLGPRAADTMVGSLAADLVRFVVGMLVLPLRLVRWAIRSWSNTKKRFIN
jgi:hypothetical protein